ncbi:epidermis-specific secreted EP1-like glycoprotein [Medicago truncatula]|uniref:Epidermis-specific secreted EP1-like glycoprotein n=1 Tax=Medicago truncatula TaxID=3880 RepID=G7IH69_MEDTR|nr:epidermis-specific secreted EP1-like glycoprotein [Medicago truncatula]
MSYFYINSFKINLKEYGGNYRMINIFNAPFQVGFYNTTPNAFTLALRMGLQRSEQLFWWVWEANRGSPVDENATFSLEVDENLVLANADGRIIWQTNTSNKVLLPLGKFVWQSFDHPTDTLLVDQYLKANGPSKLVSRLSEKENVDGPYSLVFDPKGLTLYYKSKNSPRPIPYWNSSNWYSFEYEKLSLENVTLISNPFEIGMEIFFVNVAFLGMKVFSEPVNNSTLTYPRLGIDVMYGDSMR